jgi:hypothetical protein
MKFLLRIPCILLLLCSDFAIAQEADLLKQDLKDYFIKQTDAWTHHDINAIDPGDVNRGFGYRSMALRTSDNRPQDNSKQRLEAFFKTMKYFRVEPGEFHVEVEGNIGLIWGIFIENFQIVGKPPERVRVRFSTTYRRAENGRWIPLMGHRDIQPFDESGQYIPIYLDTEVTDP